MRRVDRREALRDTSRMELVESIGRPSFAVDAARIPIAAGWYLACFSDELAPKRALEIVISGQKLVVFRMESGRVAVHDAYCAHMGASLACGAVAGESIQCPFHRWRYDATGACVEIPGADKIPPAARVKTYPVVERFGAIFAHVGGETPRYELPEEEEVFDGGKFFRANVNDFGEVPVHGRDLLENAVDPTHAPFLHHIEITNYSVLGIDMPKLSTDADVTVMGKVKIKTRTTLFGPGLWANWIEGGLYRMPVVWLLMATPISPTRTRLRGATFVRGNAWNPMTRLLARFYAVTTANGAKQDLDLWRDKVIVERPLLTSADIGPIMKFRKWYGEFSEPARARASI